MLSLLKKRQPVLRNPSENLGRVVITSTPPPFDDGNLMMPYSVLIRHHYNPAG